VFEDLELLVVEDLAQLLDVQLGQRLRMRPTAVIHRHDAAVRRGDLVGAGAESGLHRARERQEESAGATEPGCLLGHRRIRSPVADEPAVGGIEPAETGQHPRASHTELEGDFGHLGVIGQDVGRHQPGVVDRRRVDVTGA
jgi:hypothetical protein